MDKRKTVVIATLIALIVINSILIAYLCLSKFNEQKIVSFNMKETINLFILQMKNNNLNEEQINSTTLKFNTVLDETIQAYSKKNNVLILVKPAVVFGVDDVTDEIQSIISEKMAN